MLLEVQQQHFSLRQMALVCSVHMYMFHASNSASQSTTAWLCCMSQL
jgi:hypothetical protein